MQVNVPLVLSYYDTECICLFLIYIVQHRHVRMTENGLGKKLPEKAALPAYVLYLDIQSFRVLPLILRNIEICIGKIVARWSINLKYCSIKKICHGQTFHCGDALYSFRTASLRCT